jgi:hypothetical protein
MYGRLLDMVLDEAAAARCAWSSDTLEVIPLRTQGGDPPLAFVLNHAGEAVELPLPEGTTGTDLLTGAENSGALPLEGFGVVLWSGPRAL